jgi:hypothetical protein
VVAVVEQIVVVVLLVVQAVVVAEMEELAVLELLDKVTLAVMV